jgi:hypothetical protein
MGERFNLEFEGSAETEYSNVADLGHASANMFVHGFGRNGAGAIGLFGGYSSVEMFRSDIGNVLTGGAEVQGYLGNVTLYGQAGVFSSTAVNDPYFFDFHGWFARATARYFLTPRTRMQVDAQWTSITPGEVGDGASAFTLIGTVERQFANAPFAGFVNVRWDRVDHDNLRDIDALQTTIGLRFNFGGNAFENDRDGATMDVIPLPLLSVLHVS